MRQEGLESLYKRCKGRLNLELGIDVGDDFREDEDFGGFADFLGKGVGFIFGAKIAFSHRRDAENNLPIVLVVQRGLTLFNSLSFLAELAFNF